MAAAALLASRGTPATDGRRTSQEVRRVPEFSAAVRDLAERTRGFVREQVLPVEDELGGVPREDDAWRRGLQDAAKAAGVFGPHLPAEYGGHDLGMADRAPVFEEAGYSLFGPLALNAHAPDEGNIHLLQHVASPEQRERFLRPLATGEHRSSFAMTEPAPGAGSDPRALLTRAERTAQGWRINGRKHFITGADGHGFSIVMARTSGEPGDRGGATMFLVPADTPGMVVERHMNTMDKAMPGGHCEVTFSDCEVGDEAVLGEVDRGFEYAQVRLGPARMTHCMRWLGAARRAHELMVERTLDRSVFGSPLSGLGMAQQMIADNEIDLAASRALVGVACRELDDGGAAATSTSIAKVFCAEAVGRVVDRALQLHGGLGVTEDLPIARIYREIRPFRIYDGPSEVHRWALARRAVSRTRRAREGGDTA